MLTIEKHRFQVLDGWRGVCAILVAVYHANIMWSFVTAHAVRNLFVFVDFFFVLSGFVISYAYGQKIVGAYSLRGFMLRRFGRVWPLHIATLSAVIMLEAAKWFGQRVGLGDPLQAAFTGPTDPGAILPQILLVHAFGPHSNLTFNGPSWSISTEFWAYVVFAIATLVTRGRVRWLSIALILLGLALQYGGEVVTGIELSAFGRCLAGFFVGVIVHEIWRNVPRPNATVARFLEVVALALVVALIVISDRERVVWGVLPIFGFAVLVFSFEAGAISAILRTRMGEHLGSLSYSIYMTHAVIFMFVARIASLSQGLMHRSLFAPVEIDGTATQYISFGNTVVMDAMLLAYIAAILFVSYFSYRLIEVPARRYFNEMARASTVLSREAGR